VQAPVADYTKLREYAGGATSVFVLASGIAGTFVRDDADTTSADNGGTIIVATNGKRWKRVYQGALDVRWFGVVGAGDDRTAFVAALAAMSSGSVLDLAGLSIVTGNGLALTGKNNIQIKNGKLVGKLTDTTGFLLTLTSCTGVWLSDLEFDAKNSVVSGQQLFSVRVVDCSDVTCERVNFSDAYNGVITGGTANHRIRLRNCRMVGTLPYSAPNAAAFVLSVSLFYAFAPTFESGVDECYAENLSHLILSEATSEDNYATNNVVKNSHDTAIYFYGPGSVATGNKVYYAGKDGIKINQTSGVGARIAGNYIYGAGVIKADGGVCITSLSANAVIEGNVLVLLPVASRAAASTIGIVLYNSNQSAEGNVITSESSADVSTFGITLGTNPTANASNISIADNILTGLWEAIKFGNATAFAYSNINVTGNRIRTCVRGIYSFLSDASYTRINQLALLNNSITDYSGAAIIITLSNDVVVSGNRGYEVAGTSGTFFRNEASHNVTLTNNTTDGNETTFLVNVNVGADTPTYSAAFGNMKGSAAQSPGTPSNGYTVAGRPSAATVGRGTWIWNVDTNKPNWSDGANWRDAAGAVV
jgi:hypothetical protein